MIHYHSVLHRQVIPGGILFVGQQLLVPPGASRPTPGNVIGGVLYETSFHLVDSVADLVSSMKAKALPLIEFVRDDLDGFTQLIGVLAGYSLGGILRAGRDDQRNALSGEFGIENERLIPSLEGNTLRFAASTISSIVGRIVTCHLVGVAIDLGSGATTTTEMASWTRTRV